MSEILEYDSISVWGERTINIGDYESSKIGISRTRRFIDINRVDKKVVIRESATAKAKYQDGDQVEQDLINKIRQRLDDQEFEIRSAINDYVEHPNLHKVKTLLGVNLVSADEDITEHSKAVNKEAKKSGISRPSITKPEDDELSLDDIDEGELP